MVLVPCVFNAGLSGKGDGKKLDRLMAGTKPKTKPVGTVGGYTKKAHSVNEQAFR